MLFIGLCSNVATFRNFLSVEHNKCDLVRCVYTSHKLHSPSRVKMFIVIWSVVVIMLVDLNASSISGVTLMSNEHTELRIDEVSSFVGQTSYFRSGTLKYICTKQYSFLL